MEFMKRKKKIIAAVIVAGGILIVLIGMGIARSMNEDVSSGETVDVGEAILQQETEPLDHDFEKSIWETATCLKGGYYNNVCKHCGLVENTTEDPLPHDVEDIVIQEGNCMEDTIIRHVCKSCGQQVESDTYFTPQTHSWISGIVDDNEVSYCEWCGVVR